MSATALESIFEESLALSDDQRMELVERLIPTIGSIEEIEPDQLLEAKKRQAEVQAGEVELIPGEDALAQVRLQVQG